MKPLQVVPTRSLSPWMRAAARWLPQREARTPMGGRIIRLAPPGAASPWLLALVVLLAAPMVLLGVATVV